ncbi:Metal-pseudopaline receptor CntO (plasmid) [Asticcacaulis sp. MM231]|uniref:TonB-dependent siderophore receptor n=1 Tax=Asticcacaulis sp. MM231 TaxID=3157666 RepID=UPI0032D570A9
MKQFLFLSAATFALISASAATAQETAPDDTKGTEVIVVGEKLLPAQTTTANKTKARNLLTPQAIQVVPEQVLDDQHTLTLAEATRNVAGVTTDFGFNGETQPLLILRGFSSTSMTAMGSMSGSSTYYVDGAKVTGLPVNMADVKSVEVIKGPNSVLFGRGEPGGLVNVVSRSLKVKPGFDFEQTLGEYGLSRSVLSASGAVNEDKSLLLGFSTSQYDTDSYRDFVEEHMTAFGLRGQWSPNTNNTLYASVDYVDHSYRTDYGLPAIGDRVANLPLNTQYNDAPQLSGEKSVSARVEYTHAFSDDWSLKIRGVKVTADTEEVDIAPYRVDLSGSADPLCDIGATPATTCRYYYYVRPDGKYDMHQVTADLTGTIRWGGATHNVLVGAETYEAQKSGTTYFEQIASVDLYNPALGGAPGLDTSLAMPMDMEDRNSWEGVYAQDQIDFGNGLNLVIALRHDKTKAIYAMPGTAPNEVSFTSPRVGLVWAYKSNQVFYGQYQKSLSANNGRDVDGITALKPEIAQQSEVGYKYVSPDNRLSANVAIYELTKKNRSDYSLYPQTILTTGEARSRGVEVDALGEITSKLSLIASYAYTEAKVVEDAYYTGKTLANVPKTAASLWASYDVSPKWRLGAGAFYQGDRWGDVGNTFIMPAYTRVDAMASYSFKASGAQAALQLNVNNLFDTRYYTGSHQFVADWVHPGAPRTVSLSLRLAY